MAQNIWPPPVYNGKVRFEVWELQLDMYISAKKITDDGEKALALLQHIGMEMLEKIMDWCYPKKPKDFSYDDLVKLIKSQCSSGPNLFARRVRLFNERQQSDQSVQEYFSYMRQLLGQCEMKTMTPEGYGVLAALRGLQSDELRQFLMSPTNDISSMEKAQALAVSFDQSRMAAKDIKAREERFEPLGMNVVGKGYKCGYCGGVHQKGKDNCPAKGATCNQCKKNDHFSKVCRSGRKQYLVEEDSECLNGIYPYSVLAVTSKLEDIDPPFMVETKLDGVDIDFQHDTGSACTVINKEIWHMIGKPKIFVSNMKLKSYNKMIPVIGRSKVIVQVGKQIKQLWVTVVPQGASLFGRDWMKAFQYRLQETCIRAREQGRGGSPVFKQNTVTVIRHPADRRTAKDVDRSSYWRNKTIKAVHDPMQGKEVGESSKDLTQRNGRQLAGKSRPENLKGTVLKGFKSQKTNRSKCLINEAGSSKQKDYGCRDQVD